VESGGGDRRLDDGGEKGEHDGDYEKRHCIRQDVEEWSIFEFFVDDGTR